MRNSKLWTGFKDKNGCIICLGDYLYYAGPNKNAIRLVKGPVIFFNNKFCIEKEIQGKKCYLNIAGNSFRKFHCVYRKSNKK